LDFGVMLSMVGAAIELAALDLLLGADNAVVIALACRPLPPRLRKRVLLIGFGGAILLRFGLMVLVSALLSVPALRLAAAVFLIWIAIRLLGGAEDASGEALAGAGAMSPARINVRLWEAVLIVIAADAIMSLDNVVALVSVAQGNTTLLILGLLLSIPALLYGSFVMSKMLDEWPLLIVGGSVLLVWIAGQMAASDDLINAWISRQAPALAVVLPALCACYVYIVGGPSVKSSDLRS
jgi:YjbE family integral membrane protein